MNQISWTTLIDDWNDVWGKALTTPMKLEVGCDAQTITAPCIADPLAGSITLPLAQWQADGGRFFRWFEEPLGGDGVDNLAYFKFNLDFEYGDAGTDQVAHKTSGTSPRR